MPKVGLPSRYPTAELAGLVFDDAGNAMTSVSARKGKGRRYRYYVSTALQRGRRDQAGTLARFPGPALEELLRDRLGQLGVLGDAAGLRTVVEHIEAGRRKVVVRLAAGVELGAANRLQPGEIVSIDDGQTVLVLPATLKWRGGSKIAVSPDGAATFETLRVDAILLGALVRAEACKGRLLRGEIRTVDDLARLIHAGDGLPG